MYGRITPLTVEKSPLTSTLPSGCVAMERTTSSAPKPGLKLLSILVTSIATLTRYLHFPKLTIYLDGQQFGPPARQKFSQSDCHSGAFVEVQFKASPKIAVNGQIQLG